MVNITNRILHNENDRITANQSKQSELNSTGKAIMAKFEEKENEYILHGRNTFAFWTIVSLLFIFAIGNLILTLTIFGVLGLGKGVAFLEVVPEENILKFTGSIDLDRIYKKDGKIEGFYNNPLLVTGDKAPIVMNHLKPNGHVHDRFVMNKNGTQFFGFNQFELHDKRQPEKHVFSVHKPIFTISSKIDNLVSKTISSSRISARIGDDLVMNQTSSNRSKISIRGSEGVHFKSKEILLDGENIHLKTYNGSIYFTTDNGVFLDVKRVPIVQERGGIRMEEKQYKICVCMPEGRLFRVAIPQKHNNIRDICNTAYMESNPCI